MVSIFNEAWRDIGEIRNPGLDHNQVDVRKVFILHQFQDTQDEIMHGPMPQLHITLSVNKSHSLTGTKRNLMVVGRYSMKNTTRSRVSA